MDNNMTHIKPTVENYTEQLEIILANLSTRSEKLPLTLEYHEDYYDTINRLEKFHENQRNTYKPLFDADGQLNAEVRGYG